MPSYPLSHQEEGAETSSALSARDVRAVGEGSPLQQAVRFPLSYLGTAHTSLTLVLTRIKYLFCAKTGKIIQRRFIVEKTMLYLNFFFFLKVYDFLSMSKKRGEDRK